jgi:AcrR family transcriptional regulator
MNRPDFQRARSPERKARRRADLLAAAGALVDAEGPEAVSLAAIAARAGVVKSGVYRYFESREEILARLLVADLDAAMDEVAEALDALPDGAPPETMAAPIARAFAARPRLCRLVAVFATVLERNISPDRLVDIKTEVFAAAERVAAAAARAFPSIPAGAWTPFVSTAFAMVAGMWPLSVIPEHVREAARAAGRPDMSHDFEPLCEWALGRMLRGMAEG